MLDWTLQEGFSCSQSNSPDPLLSPFNHLVYNTEFPTCFYFCRFLWISPRLLILDLGLLFCVSNCGVHAILGDIPSTTSPIVHSCIFWRISLFSWGPHHRYQQSLLQELHQVDQTSSCWGWELASGRPLRCSLAADCSTRFQYLWLLLEVFSNRDSLYRVSCTGLLDQTDQSFELAAPARRTRQIELPGDSLLGQPVVHLLIFHQLSQPGRSRCIGEHFPWSASTSNEHLEAMNKFRRS